MSTKPITVAETLDMANALTLSIQNQVNEFNKVTGLLIDGINVRSSLTFDGSGVSVINLSIIVPQR